MLFTERIIKIITADLKSRIDTCQKDCASLKDRFNSRLRVDTNIQVKEIKGGVQQTGTFLRVCSYLPLISESLDIGRMMIAMIDDKLGSLEFHASING